MRGAALDLAEGEQRVLMRVNVAGYYRLHHRYELRRDDYRVNAHLRSRGVGAFAVDFNDEIARLRHEIFPAYAYLARGHGRPKMQTVDAVYLGVCQSALVYHLPCARPALHIRAKRDSALCALGIENDLEARLGDRNELVRAAVFENGANVLVSFVKLKADLRYTVEVTAYFNAIVSHAEDLVAYLHIISP